MSLVDEITMFIKNIHIAKDKYLNEDSLPMWIREIINTKVDIATLQKAEIVIIRENIPLVVTDICDCIREQINLNKPRLVYNKVKCPYCEGRGWVEGLKFEKNGKYTGYRVALNCCCGNKPTINMAVMKEDLSNLHKTETRDGYVLVFPSIVEEFAYLDKVYANNDYDLRRKQ